MELGRGEWHAAGLPGHHPELSSARGTLFWTLPDPSPRVLRPRDASRGKATSTLLTLRHGVQLIGTPQTEVTCLYVAERQKQHISPATDSSNKNSRGKKIKKMRNQLLNGATSLSLQYFQFHLSENPRNKI